MVADVPPADLDQDGTAPGAVGGDAEAVVAGDGPRGDAEPP
ncbi:hypothetical protein [Nonomuraea sp. KM90]